MDLLKKRQLYNKVALTLSMLAMASGLFWLIWILFTTLQLGISGMSLDLFTQMTPPPNTPGGGLANAISGSLVLVGLATLVGTPIGILAGVYLAEYGQRTWLGRTTRFINGILLSAPSIVIGLFVYAFYVERTGHFSKRPWDRRRRRTRNWRKCGCGSPRGSRAPTSAAWRSNNSWSW